jgi:hypothetical protein
VRKQKEAGADLIKIYASGGMRQGPMTLSQEQLNAACDEAKKQGLRTLVHAYRDAVRAATLAECTEVEHGLGATDDDLKLMAEKGTYFDPQAGLLLETYLLHKDIGGKGGVLHNTVTDNVWSPCVSLKNCSFNATGILKFQSDAVRVEHNSVATNQVGVFAGGAARHD